MFASTLFTCAAASRCDLVKGMTLEKYLLKKKITAREFSKQSGIGETVISRWLHKGALPSFGNLRRAIEASGGEISERDFAVQSKRERRKYELRK